MRATVLSFPRVMLAAIALGIAGLAYFPASGQQPAGAPAPAQPAAAPGTLKGELVALAGQVADYIKKDSRAAEVDVRPYRCARELNASAGPGIQKLLMDELDKLGIKNKPGARIACVGEYTYVSRIQRVSIQTQILENNQPKFEFSAIKSLVSDIEGILAVTGATGAVAVNDPIQAKKDVAAAIERPAVQIDPVVKSQALAVKSSPFGVELCRKDKATGAFLPIVLETDEGQAYAPLKVTDVYGIRIYNRADFPVAVNVTIDGLNLFVLSEIPQFKALGKLIIPPQKDHLIQGWFITNEKALEFLVTDLPDALVAKLAGAAPPKNPEGVGTVTVSFCAAVTDPNGKLPPGEPDIRSATATGAPVGVKYQTVAGVNIGKVREVVSIRYDRPEGLPPAEKPVIAPPAAVGK